MRLLKLGSILSISCFIIASGILTLLGLQSIRYVNFFGSRRNAATYPVPSKTEFVYDASQSDKWNTIFPDSLFVYSARTSLAFSPYEVHITAITDVRHKLPDVERETIRCLCDFYSTTSVLLARTEAVLEDFGECHAGELNETIRFVSARFWCLLPTNPYEDAGLRLTCQRKNSTSGSADFCVKRLPSQPPVRYTFVHCGSPLWGPYNGSSDMIEFIEYYKLMGVLKFVFYVVAVSDDAMKVLEYYGKEGTVEVVSWIIPVSEKEIWYFGQMAMLNDCFLRTGPHWDYTLNVDVDEFIAITNQEDLIQLAQKEQSDCVVILHSAMQPFVTGLNANSMKTIALTTRQDYVFDVNSRSKYFCRAGSIIEHGVHIPWRTTAESAVAEADPADVILLHYRTKMIEEAPAEFADLWVTETRAQNFSVARGVVERVENVRRSIFDA